MGQGVLGEHKSALIVSDSHRLFLLLHYYGLSRGASGLNWIEMLFSVNTLTCLGWSHRQWARYQISRHFKNSLRTVCHSNTTAGCNHGLHAFLHQHCNSCYTLNKNRHCPLGFSPQMHRNWAKLFPQLHWSKSEAIPLITVNVTVKLHQLRAGAGLLRWHCQPSWNAHLLQHMGSITVASDFVWVEVSG